MESERERGRGGKREEADAVQRGSMKGRDNVGKRGERRER